MSQTASIRFVRELAQQMGSQMQLCCSRTLGNLPTLPPRDHDHEGRLA